jgi:hypothetical protein
MMRENVSHELKAGICQHVLDFIAVRAVLLAFHSSRLPFFAFEGRAGH